MAIPKFSVLVYRRDRIQAKIKILSLTQPSPSVRGQIKALGHEMEKTTRLLREYYRRIR